MTTCLTHAQSHPFTTPVPSFTLKPRVEKDDPPAMLGRGLRIRSSFDDEDGEGALSKRERTGSAGEEASGSFETPEWAVRASGEARLEPVGSTQSTHDSIDLSSKACILIGRSPSSDMRLMEPTCSRKHALIFHHPNGSCYIVDCGSAHGTHVNGVRVDGPSPQRGEKKALAVPHRVRKGALIRFGGPDGPTFVLRSFPATLEGLVCGLGSSSNASSSIGLPIVRADGGSCSPAATDRPVEGEKPSFLPTLAPSTPRAHKPLEPAPSCTPTSALVALNTRLNALGGGAGLSRGHRRIAQRAASKLAEKPTEKDQINYCLHGKRYRPDDDLACSDDYDDDDSCPLSPGPLRLVKRFRSATFPLSPQPTCPSLGCLKVRDLDTLTPLVSQDSLHTLEEDILRKIEGRRRVKFHDERYFPASVTPDIPGSRSFDEEHFASLKM